jgi:hypothetical protein
VPKLKNTPRTEPVADNEDAASGLRRFAMADCLYLRSM